MEVAGSSPVIRSIKSVQLMYWFFHLEVPPRIELGIRELQSHALPLGYGTIPVLRIVMERLTRLELATSTLARWRSTR